MPGPGIVRNIVDESSIHLGQSALIVAEEFPKDGLKVLQDRLCRANPSLHLGVSQSTRVLGLRNN